MLSKAIAVFFNLFARIVSMSSKDSSQRNESPVYVQRATATDLCYRIAKAAGLSDTIVGTLTAMQALADLEKKRHQLLVLVAAVERVAPALAVLTEEKRWYQKLFGTGSVYKDQRAELDLKKDIEVLLDVLRRIKAPEE